MIDKGDTIQGNLEQAIRTTISNLIEGKKSYQSILYEWDSLRGNDWIVQTKKSQQEDYLKSLEVLK